MKKGFWYVVKNIIRKADIILEVLDARMPEITRNKRMEAYAASLGKQLILVINKADIVSANTLTKIREQYRGLDYLLLSSKTSAGLSDLYRLIRSRIKKEDIENNRQLCIREEQGQDKLNKYLVCILDSDNPNAPKDVSVCEKEAGIDSAKLQTCLKNKADSYFASDSALSQGYGVQGSPTLIINGVQSSAGRTPASYLDGVCSAFNTARHT